MWKELIIKVKVVNQKKNKKEVDLYLAYYKYKVDSIEMNDSNFMENAC